MNIYEASIGYQTDTQGPVFCHQGIYRLPTRQESKTLKILAHLMYAHLPPIIQ